MTDAMIADLAAGQGLLIAQWSARCRAIIDTRIDQAHAHAILALTDTLKATPDGRPTVRQARHSTSYQSAISDLNALLDRLVGPAVNSLEGEIRRARVALYCQAFQWYRRNLPAQMTVSPDPADARLNEVRSLVLHGYELRAEMLPKFQSAERQLISTLAVAGRSTTPQKQSNDFIRGWADRTRNAFASACEMSIGDAAGALDAVAAHDALKPEFRPDANYLPI